MPELSILIPCLNEADSLPLLIDRLEKLSISTDLDVETIILDDASTDDTIEVARMLQATHGALNIRIIHRFEPRRGYGALIRYGLACATGRYCLLVAADGAHPIEMVGDYLALARRGAQLVQCSRYERPEDQEDIPPRFRTYQAIYRSLVRLLLGWDIRDRIYLLAIGIRHNGVAVVPEITFKIWLSGGRVVFVAGRQTFRRRGISQFRILREACGYGYVLLRAWLHRLGLPWF
jgi:glycosyltransferase involved in cell wall biosynthesis